MAGFGHRQMLNKTNEKADFKSVKKLFLYIKPYLPSIIIALVLAVFGAITTIVGPEKISDLMNIITNGLTTPNGVDMTKFVEIAVMLICLYLAGAIANYIQQFLMAGVTQKTSKRLRTDINKKINNLPLKYFDTTTRGDILSRVTNDVDTISQTFGSTIANLVNAITLFFGVLIMMFTVNWILALITIGTSILGFVLMSIILRKSQKYFQLRQQNLGEMNGHIEEIYTNHNVVKSYNAEDKSKEKFKGINKKLFTNNWKSQALSGLMPPIMNFAGNLSYATIFIVGVALILNGSTAITFGTIISFTIYARLFSQPLSTIAQSMNSLQQTAAASKRVFDLLDEEELIDESKKKAKIEENAVVGNVEFRNVRFGYVKDKTIINNFTANLKAGQKVAIVGPTASGKTSLSIEVAKRFKGEIVSADSMQIYKKMNIATAKPTEEEMAEVKHHLIGFVDMDDSYSVARYKRAALEAMDTISAEGKLPVIVGGTGFYVDTLLKNTEFLDYEKSDIREKLSERVEKEGIEVLYKELQGIDPVTAQRLHINDEKRIIRALELYYSTGKTITEQSENSHNVESEYDWCIIGLKANERQYLYDRINLRVDMMLEEGLIEEAEEFFDSDYSDTAKQAIGYKELKPYLDGAVCLEEAVEKLKMETRRYAKRQLTWFRRNPDIRWLDIDLLNKDELIDAACYIIKEHLGE